MPRVGQGFEPEIIRDQSSYMVPEVVVVSLRDDVVDININYRAGQLVPYQEPMAIALHLVPPWLRSNICCNYA